ncbi:hypothetical protein, partial [Cypionkella sp.]|uniref:hypothetical protein n=1 Tax=Cypionkella sp. TaxID=2811411 RepID=UPI002AB925D4
VTFNAAAKPILTIFGEASASDIYRVVSAYLRAFIDQANERKFDIDITQPVVFRAILMVLPEVAQRVSDKFGKNYKADDFAKIIAEMMKNVKVSSVKSVGKSVSAYAKVFTDGLKTKSIF